MELESGAPHRFEIEADVRIKVVRSDKNCPPHSEAFFSVYVHRWTESLFRFRPSGTRTRATDDVFGQLWYVDVVVRETGMEISHCTPSGPIV